MIGFAANGTPRDGDPVQAPSGLWLATAGELDRLNPPTPDAGPDGAGTFLDRAARRHDGALAAPDLEGPYTW